MKNRSFGAVQVWISAKIKTTNKAKWTFQQVQNLSIHYIVFYELSFLSFPRVLKTEFGLTLQSSAWYDNRLRLA